MALRSAAPWKPPGVDVYYFRKAVPEGLRPVVGRREIRRTLKTRDPEIAKARHAEIAIEIAAEWERLRDIVARQQAHEPETHREVRLIALSQKDAHALAGELYREQVAAHEDDPGSATDWDLRLREIYDAIPLAERPSDAPNRWWNYSMRPVAVAQRQFGTMVNEFLERRGLALDTRSHRLVCSAVALAMRDASQRLKRNAQGDYSPDPAAARFPPAEPVLARSPLVAHQPISVEEVLAKWFELTHVAQSTQESWSGKLRSLARFAGKVHDVAAITKEDVAAWRNHRKKSGTSARTISMGDLAGTRAIFKWAVDEADLPSIVLNPVDGVSIDFKEPARTREKGFKLKEAELILRSSLMPAEGFTQAGAGARRWVPWLCAFNGARVGEVGQAHSRNVFEEETPSGLKIWCLRLTPEDGSIKDDEARVVPIHPQIIEQGFLDYVALREGKPLFYEPGLVRKQGTHHRQADKVGERLAAWVRDLGIPPPVQPNHGWRHRFETIGRNLALRKDLIDYIMGHGAADVAGDYGDYLYEALYKAICHFPRYLEKRDVIQHGQSERSAGGVSIFAEPST
jgi:hypothetical protein